MYLIIFINDQTETVGDVNGILSLDPGHFYLGSTGRTRVSVAENKFIKLFDIRSSN